MRAELGVVVSILIRTVSVSEKADALSALSAHCMSLASTWGEASSTLSRVIDLVIVVVIIRTIALTFVIAVLIDLITPILLFVNDCGPSEVVQEPDQDRRSLVDEHAAAN